MTETLITTTQAAEVLNIDRRTVWHKIKAGKIKPVYKHPGNGTYLFDRAEIEALAEAEGAQK